MMLPSGVNKAIGVQRVLDELNRSARNMIAFGDAENDIPLLLEAEVGVAARGAVPAVLSVADDSVSQPGGAGVALYIRGTESFRVRSVEP
jgi:hydroxymethylpyrimidine pyrophosphatase-like HAD family hydrolase